MVKPFKPTLLYPNGGETILTSSINIQWNNSSYSIPIDIAKIPKKIEIFYTLDYNINEESDWTQIATVPTNVESFVWRYGKNIKGNKCRVAIRTRGIEGSSSDFSISSADFSIQQPTLVSPLIISPVHNGKYNKFIEIMTDDTSIIESFSQRSSYQFFYSSASLDIPKTSIAQDVAIGSGTYIWDISGLSPANDYVFQAYLEDDNGNQSNSVFVKNISISHDGDFIVDTLPPIASITINNNANFTKTRDINVNIVAADETTGVHAVRIKEELNENSKKYIDENISEPEPNANVKRFVLSDPNDVKTIQLLAQDYGANRNDESTKFQRVLQVLVELEDTEIVDIAVDQNNAVLWAVTTGTYKNLYKITDFPALISTFEDEPTSIALFQSVVYVATKSAGKGSLYKFIGDVELEETFDTVDSVINTMAIYDDKLFLGMENGMIYSFDGLAFVLIDTVSGPTKQLYSDGNVLYLSQKNNLNVYVWNGSEFITT